MKTLSIEVPENIAGAIRLPDSEQPQRLLLELALSLYAQELIPFGKAAELAGLDLHAFSKELGHRRIPRHYSTEDFEQDLHYARGE